MEDVWIVEITDKDGYGFGKYNGTDKVEATKIFEEFKSRKRFKVEFYQKVIVEVIDCRETITLQ